MKHRWIWTVGVNVVAMAMSQALEPSTAVDGVDVAPKTPSLIDRFDFGAYGELHGSTGDGDDSIDMHRMVGLMNVQLTDRLKFVSELEFEHVFYHDDGNGDEDMQIEVEQAYFEYAVSDDLYLTAGIQMLPIGITNSTHEPTTFYGVERPSVEKYIIPTSWWEGALGVTKTYDSGLQLDLLFHNAMNMTTAGYIRSGHEKMDLNQYTENQSWAVTGRAKYTGIAGIELGAAAQYQDDVSTSVSGNQESYMLESHAIYRKGGFQLRALAAGWHLEDFNKAITEDQWGYYIEPSYSFDIPWGKLGYFARFSQYQYFETSNEDIKEYVVGMNYWPIESVVLKTDCTIVDEGTTSNETVNFGLGYSF